MSGEEMAHLAHRPSWDCRDCGQPWPCDPALARLTAEYTGNETALVLYLATQYVAASGDLSGQPDTLLASLYDRFTNWRQRTRAGRPPDAEEQQ